MAQAVLGLLSTALGSRGFSYSSTLLREREHPQDEQLEYHKACHVFEALDLADTHDSASS